MTEWLLAAALPRHPLDAHFDRPGLRSAWVAAIVTDEDGNVLYSRNADRAMIPASNQKLLSVAYALWKLGPEFRPVTRIWKFEDRLIVDAPGDPSMTHARLAEASRKLNLSKRVPVYVRQGYRPGWGPGWEWDDLPNRYAPAITAFTVDRGGFELWGDADRFWLKPANYGVTIRYIPSRTSRRSYNLLARRMTVYGPNPKSETMIEGFAIHEPDRAAAQVLGGPLFETDTVPDSEPTLTLEGDTVATMAKQCLVASDNFLAEALLMLAASQEAPLGDAEYVNAGARLKRFLVNEVGLEPEEVEPVDGSGLSRHNQVSARAIAKLLLWAKSQPTAALWMASLATPGSGTLKNRLEGSGFAGKTGTLNKVVSLSGYCKVKGSKDVIVSVILNQYSGSSAAARQAADAFIRRIEEGVIDVERDSKPNGALVEAVSNPRARPADADRLRRSRRDRRAA